MSHFHLFASILVSALLLAAQCSARIWNKFETRANVYPLIASDSMYEGKCPSDGEHMNGCFHFNVTATRRISPQLISEISDGLSDALMVNDRFIGQTMPRDAQCAGLNQIRSHLYMAGNSRCRGNVVLVYGHRISTSASQDHAGCLQVLLVRPETRVAGDAVVTVSEANWDERASRNSNGLVYFVCGPEEIPQVTLNISL